MKATLTLHLFLLLQASTAFANAKLAPIFTWSGETATNKKNVTFNIQDSHFQATALVFLSARCPCSNSHEASLQKLSEKFGSVNFIGIHSNLDEKWDETSQHFNQSPIRFPVIQDHQSELAKTFGAFKTPHVFLISNQGKILYQGGVDDSHQASQAKKHYFSDALTAVVKGQEPEIYQTRTLGCTIRRE